MKGFTRNWIIMLLVASMVLLFAPVTANALQIPFEKTVLQVTETVYIPGAMEADQQIRTVSTTACRTQILPFNQVEYATDVSQAGAVLRQAMKNRQETATVYFEADASLTFSEVVAAIQNEAMAHTGNGTEGDYLAWQRGPISAGGSYIPGGQTKQYTINFELSYYTTAQQEAQVDTAVAELQASLNMDGMSDYETLCAIYEWMCLNITYDYDHLGDDAYDLQYTAYAALIDRTSVCQGYAVLLYRLLLEEGIDCRVITGIGNGGPHAWNIVELGGKYYNLDATWDASWRQAGFNYNFFLRADATFEDHARDEEYATGDFYVDYPMSNADYVSPWNCSHNYVSTFHEPTCTQEGYDIFVCSICGDEFHGNVVGALGHSFGEWMQIDAPTCTAEGQQRRDCIRCDHYETDTIKPTGHSYQNHVCTACGLDAPTSGTCGDNLTWELSEDGTLTISGTGEMWDYDELQAPWAGYKEEIVKLVIEEGVTTIGRYAFAGYKMLNELHLPASIVKIGMQAFADSHYLYSANITDLTAWCNITFEDAESNPLWNVPISGGLYLNGAMIRDLVIPDGITEIKDYAFVNNYGLNTITIPDSVTRIGKEAFYMCARVKTVTIGNSVTSIDDKAFASLLYLEQINIPNSVTSIGYMAFVNCESLTEITIPDSVLTIGEQAFQSCVSLRNLHLGNGITYLSDSLFFNCYSLSIVVVPDSVTSIGSFTFDGCRELVAVVLPSSLTSIEDSAFDYSQRLWHILYKGSEEQWNAIRVILSPGTEAKWLDVPRHYNCKGDEIWQGLVLPKCEEEGYTVTTCNLCLQCTHSERVNALGHTPGVEATCTTAQYCTVCSVELNPAKGHTPGEEATCTTAQYCTVCSVELNSAKGHTPGEEATCVDYQYCTDCGVELADPKGHSYAEEVIAPTCTSSGYTLHTCSVCGFNYRDSYVDKIDHSFDVAVTEPTCSSSGSTKYTCVSCGYNYTVYSADPLPHEYTYEVTVAPTCETEGEWLYTCTGCGDSFTQVASATGHRNLHLENYKSATCLEDGYSGDSVCDACGKTIYYGSVIYANGSHDYWSTTVEPGCETLGLRTYTCSACGDTYTEELPATGHHTYLSNVQYANCGVDGYTGDTVCYTCGKTVEYGTVVPATGAHNYGFYDTIAPGCETPGERSYTCDVCNHHYTEQLEATGHNTSLQGYKSASCLEAGYTGDEVCDICGKTVTYGSVTPARGHRYTMANMLEPTCGTDGYTGDTLCGDCGYILEEGFRIPATGQHSYIVTVITEPTCDFSGWCNYYCPVCYDDHMEEIPATGHTFETQIVEPTCSSEGYTIYSCTSCPYSYVGDYTDRAAHHYEVVTTTVPTCTQNGYNSYYCTVCGNGYGETIPATGHQNTRICDQREANCGADGYTGDTYCDDCGECIEIGSVIQATGQHTYGSWTTIQEPTEYMTGIKIRYCQVCGASESREIPMLGHVHLYDYTVTTYAPTCTEAGYTRYQCACGDSYIADEVAALGHTVVTDLGRQPTCTDNGITEGSYCAVCHEVFVEQTVIPATGHSVVIDAAAAPTCTEHGLTEGKHCDVCGVVLVAQEEVAALGHSYEVTIIVQPTCVEDGSETYTCHCGDTYTEVLPAIGHTYTSKLVAPTCTENGYTVHTCENCGATYTDSHVDALGHSWDAGVVTKEPTEEEEGEKTYTCIHCGETKVETIAKKQPVIFDTPEDDSVTIPENDCFEEGTVVTVEVIQEGETLETVTAAMETVAQKYVAYEFVAMKNDAAVQPNGTLTVTFAIPEGYSDHVSVYYMDARGKLTKLESVVDAERRTVTVELAHFSTYILADQDSAPTVLVGDVNGDGRINARDARVLLRYLAGLEELDATSLAAADYNGDGRVNARDARAILQFLAGIG